MANKTLPTPEELRKILRYEPDTGKLFWVKKEPHMINSENSDTRVRISRNWNARYQGKETFTSVSKRGPLTGCVGCKKLYAHRVAWVIYHGEWPKGEIDHINGNQLDNRIANLRDVSSSVNSQNTKIYSSNKSGHHGVWWDADRKKYQTFITKDGKRKSLGRFSRLTDAIQARKEAETDLGFHKNHGRATPFQAGQ